MPIVSGARLVSTAAWHTGGSLPCSLDRSYRYYLGHFPEWREDVSSYRGQPLPDVQWPYNHWSFVRSGQVETLFCVGGTSAEGGPMWLDYQLEASGNGSFFKRLWKPSEMYQMALEMAAKYRPWVINEVYANANEPLINLAATYAEMGETLSYVADALRKVGELTLAVLFRSRRKDLLKFAWSATQGQDVWLQYRYAILPLVLELQSFYEYFSNRSAKFVPYQERKSKRAKEADRRLAEFPAGWGRQRWEQTLRKSIKTSAVLKITGKNDPAPLGTGAWDWLASQWEVVTLSFVIDWFIDIGQWFAAHRDANLTIAGSSCTSVVEIELAHTIRMMTSGTSMLTDTPVIYTGTLVNRLVGEDVVPASTPSWNPYNLSWMRQVDAVALSVAFLKSLKPKTRKSRF